MINHNILKFQTKQYMIQIIANKYNHYIITDNTDNTNNTLIQLKTIFFNYKFKIEFINKSSKQIYYIKERLVIDENIFYEIKRNILTFAQTDDTLRYILHNSIYTYIKNIKTEINNLQGAEASASTWVLIGGECYIYGKMISLICSNPYIKNIIYISDTESIISDSELNSNQNIKNSYILTDYSDHDQINKINIVKPELIITNVSPTGLGSNLINLILKSKPKHLINIHCKEKSYMRDHKMLEIDYKSKIKNIYMSNYSLILSYYNRLTM